MEQVRVTYGEEDKDAVPWGRLCRLIVVGVNSFHSGKEGYDGTYTIEENDGTPHVVFQFQHIPVVRRMNAADTNEGGYEKSEMRKYLVPVTGDSASGNFLTGLKNAGVPEGVLWAPKRVLSKGRNGAGSVTLSDKLWLPTEAEMFGYGHYSADGEMAENQAWLEYYDSEDDGPGSTYVHSSRLKLWCGVGGYPDGSIGLAYWTGSAYKTGDDRYCVVFFDGTPDFLCGNATRVNGVAPAFCVW
jgi:hypothetical protein